MPTRSTLVLMAAGIGFGATLLVQARQGPPATRPVPTGSTVPSTAIPDLKSQDLLHALKDAEVVSLLEA